MTDDESLKVPFGSENVFVDLGFDIAEALNLKLRADLMLDLRAYIHKHGWSQKEAAEFLGETQPSISNLMNGEISRFSIDKLINILGGIGFDVRIEVISKAT